MVNRSQSRSKQGVALNLLQKALHALVESGADVVVIRHVSSAVWLLYAERGHSLSRGSERRDALDLVELTLRPYFPLPSQDTEQNATLRRARTLEQAAAIAATAILQSSTGDDHVPEPAPEERGTNWDDAFGFEADEAGDDDPY